MQYVSSIERIGFKKGKQQGCSMVAQGQQGMQQGMRQGMRHGESTMLLRQMERKFGQVSEEVKQKIEEADSDTLLEWGEKIISASTIDDVFH